MSQIRKNKAERIKSQEIEFNNKVRRLAIKGIFSDNFLMERLVLKGGSALDLVYGIQKRSSFNLDFSLEGELPEQERDELAKRIERGLQKVFEPEQLVVFDLIFEPVESEKPAWGGDEIRFKIIEKDKFESFRKNPGKLRTQAKAVHPDHGTVMKIQISKFEFCQGKRKQNFENFTIYLYSPAMLLIEKLRAICQQMPEYPDRPNKSARARDFFDIFNLMEFSQIDLTSPENRELINNIFNAKGVPVGLLWKIEASREFHRPDWDSVKSTVNPGVKLEEFDFYFNYVIKILKNLETPGDI